MSALSRATLDDLHAVEGKAELIGGRIVRFPPIGIGPALIGSRIYRAIDDHAKATGRGWALTGSVGFAITELASGRESFCPDASYSLGSIRADDMEFVSGSPTFAVEVRSKGDYGPEAEDEMAAKRADYFEAGTAVVWDVDPLAKVIRVYRHVLPDRPDVFGSSDSADAEPVMPGWRLDLTCIFD